MKNSRVGIDEWEVVEKEKRKRKKINLGGGLEASEEPEEGPVLILRNHMMSKIWKEDRKEI